MDHLNSGYQVVDQYVNAMVELKPEMLAPLLSEDITFGLDTDHFHAMIKGKEAVMDFFQTNYFAVTSNIAVKKVEIDSSKKVPVLICSATEDKEDEDGKRRIVVNETTNFHLVFENGVPKIDKIEAVGDSKVLHKLTKEKMMEVVNRWQGLTISYNMSLDEKKSIAESLFSKDFTAKLTCISVNQTIVRELDREGFLASSVEKIFNNVMENVDSNRELLFGNEPNAIVFNQSCKQYRKGSGVNEEQEGWYQVEGTGVYTLGLEDDGIKITRYEKEYAKEPIVEEEGFSINS